MLIINIPMPHDCQECRFMRCGLCIPQYSKNISEYAKSRTKPNHCPIIKEIDECEVYNNGR